MTQRAERNDVFELVGALRVLKVPYWSDMVNVRFETDILLIFATYLAFTIVPLPGITSH